MTMHTKNIIIAPLPCGRGWCLGVAVKIARICVGIITHKGVELTLIRDYGAASFIDWIYKENADKIESLLTQLYQHFSIGTKQSGYRN
jgi:hypothetical protein